MATNRITFGLGRDGGVPSEGKLLLLLLQLLALRFSAFGQSLHEYDLPFFSVQLLSQFSICVFDARSRVILCLKLSELESNDFNCAFTFLKNFCHSSVFVLLCFGQSRSKAGHIL